MTKREQHAQLLDSFLRAPDHKTKYKIKRKIEGLTLTEFRKCHTCKQDFMTKHFSDELPADDDLICPACRFKV